jgi:hypothetical protein
MPGALVRGDLNRLMPYDAVPIDWAVQHLRASTGSLIATAAGEYMQVPSLVPAQREDGSCHWLNEDGTCQVHADAPYGCAFHDEHMPPDQHRARQLAAILDRIKAFQSEGAYRLIWDYLNAMDLTTVAIANRAACNAADATNQQERDNDSD